jgi:hypothetical protein
MAFIAKDTPIEILEMLSAVNYNQITAEHYNKWLETIKNNIGKHLKKRTKAVQLIELSYPINQVLCDLINQYDFSSLSILKRATVIPLIKVWANKNLPLLRQL